MVEVVQEDLTLVLRRMVDLVVVDPEMVITVVEKEIK